MFPHFIAFLMAKESRWKKLFNFHLDSQKKKKRTATRHEEKLFPDNNEDRAVVVRHKAVVSVVRRRILQRLQVPSYGGRLEQFSTLKAWSNMHIDQFYSIATYYVWDQRN